MRLALRNIVTGLSGRLEGKEGFKSVDSPPASLAYPKIDPRYAVEAVSPKSQAGTPRPSEVKLDPRLTPEHTKPDSNSFMSFQSKHQNPRTPIHVSYPTVDPRFTREAVSSGSVYVPPRIEVDTPTSGSKRKRNRDPSDTRRVSAEASGGSTIGVVYLFAKENDTVVKIGTTKRSSEARRAHYVRQHRLSGRFTVVKEWKLVRYREIEREVHRRLEAFRVSDQHREVYTLRAKDAERYIEEVIAVYRSS